MSDWRNSDWRSLVCLTIVIVLPASSQTQSLDAAMLHAAAGAVRINGNPASPSMAIFPDDLLQINQGGQAKIDAAGSTAVLGPDTMLQFEGNQLILEHGTVQVTTLTQMVVRVGCITATPALSGWTQYDVTDVNGKVTVAATKSDVNIDKREVGAPAKKKEAERSEKVTVREGEQQTREEKCGAAYRPPDYVAARAAWLNDWQIKAAGGILVGVIACFGLCHGDNPASPSDPSKR